MMQTEENKNYECLLKLVMLGEATVGKSQLLNRYIKNTFNPDSTTTLGVEFSVKEIKVEYIE